MKTNRILTVQDSKYFFNTSINTMDDAIGMAILEKESEKITFNFNAVLLLRFDGLLANELYPMNNALISSEFYELLKEIKSQVITEKSDRNFVRNVGNETYNFIIKLEDNEDKIILYFLCIEKLFETEHQLDLFSKVVGSGLSLFKGSTWMIDYDHHDGEFFMSDNGPIILGIPISKDKLYNTLEFQKVREKARVVSEKYEEAIAFEQESYEKVRRNEVDYFAGRTPAITVNDEIVWVEAYGKCVLRYPDGSPRLFIAIDIYMSEIYEEKTQLQLLNNLIDYGLVNSDVGVWYNQLHYIERKYYFTESYNKLMSTNTVFKDESVSRLIDEQIKLMIQNGRGYEEYLYKFKEIHNSIYAPFGLDKYDVVIPNFKDESTLQWIEIRGTVINRDEHGNVLLFVGVNVDVTDSFNRNQELERLRIQNERLQLAENLAIKARNLMMWYYDKNTSIKDTIFGNDVFTHKLGLERDLNGNIKVEDLLSTVVKDDRYTDNEEKVIKLFTNLHLEVTDNIKNIITRHRNLITNKEIYIEHSIEFGETSDTKLIGGVMMDVTDTIIYQKKIQYLAEYDSLTKVYNRNYFENYINTSLPESYSILIFDLDGLKLINDAFGHLEGDRIIVQLATFLREIFHEALFVARIGGDEFAVLLNSVDARKVTDDANLFETRLEEFNKKSKIEMIVSKGAKAVKDNEIEFEKAFVEAENIMYRRKLNNRSSRKSKVLDSILETLNAKTEETKAHSERLSEYAIKTMIKLGFSRASEIEDIKLLARVHDIGKVTIDDNILKKPSRLTSSEFEAVKKHCEAGYKIIRNITDSDAVCNGVLFHHERWDGKGYPQGLKGEEIPIFARVINVVDAYDAMTNDRIYSKKISHEEAVEELNKCKGSQFDPAVVEAFLASCFQ